MSYRYPLDTVNITQGFGENADYYRQFGQNGHNGIDLGTPIGTPVYASDNSTVFFEGWGVNSGWMGSIAGICVILQHNGVYTGYAHMGSTVVNKGQAIAKGELIGYSASTGTSTGPHLHFEFIGMPPNWNNGYAGRLNPSNYLEEGGDMITEDDVALVRIINSEVEGYPLNETHAGNFDTQEMNAWVGQDFRKLIWQKWTQGEGYRQRKVEAFARPEVVTKEVIVEKPVEVIKEVIKEVKVETKVPVNLGELSIGDLVQALLNKLFHKGEK